MTQPAPQYRFGRLTDSLDAIEPIRKYTARGGLHEQAVLFDNNGRIFSARFSGFSATLSAQVGTEGAILGVVTDSSGAVVAGAEVTVVNLGTNLTKKAVSDSQGNFEILALPRGMYSITAAFSGFKTWVVESAELTLGERKRVSPVLTVGEISDRVTVEAQAELIQTEKGSLESIVEQKRIVELPLNGRNPVELVRLIPGMRYTGQSGTRSEVICPGTGQSDRRRRWHRIPS